VTDLRDILAAARVVLLDFDGPICSVFAGYPAPAVAERLRDHLRGLGWHEDQLSKSDDRMVVWSDTAQRSVEAGRQIEPILRAAEIDAAATARPTPGAAELLAVCRDTHRPVAIVSNNASDAIARYLERHGLSTSCSTSRGATAPTRRS
jgi:phosphoglycolate phosphatase